MAKVTFSVRGQSWELDTWNKDTWPEEAKAALGQARPAHLCSFGDWQCPRKDVGHLCGGMPDKRYKNYPIWIVKSRHPKESPRPVPGMQLSFMDTLQPPTTGWIAAYHCARGAAWAEGLEKELGAVKVIVSKLSRIKRKLKRVIVDFGDVLNLGCLKE